MALKEVELRSGNSARARSPEVAIGRSDSNPEWNYSESRVWLHSRAVGPGNSDSLNFKSDLQH